MLMDKVIVKHITFVVVQLRPIECCDKDLSPPFVEAMICSFECAFCRVCTMVIFVGICPHCSGDLVARSIRLEAALLKHSAAHIKKAPITCHIYKGKG